MKVKDKVASARKARRVSRVEKTFSLDFNTKFAKFNLPKLEPLVIIKDDQKSRRRLKFLRHFREKAVYRFLTRMPVALSAIYGVNAGVVKDLVRYYILLYESWVSTRGESNAVKFLKELHGVAIRFCSNSKFDKLDYVSNDSYGLPVQLEPFLPLLTGNVQDRRCSLCILSLYKLVLARGEDPSTSSITDPFEIPINYEFSHRGEFYYKVEKRFSTNSKVRPGVESTRFMKVLEEMFPKRLLRRRLNQVSRLSSLHASSRNGPNGPAIGTALVDLQALHQQPDLLEAIRDLAELTRNTYVLDLLDKYPPGSFAAPTNDDLSKLPLHSRLSIKIEAGSKTRLFAIVDYFTQSVLKGFHLWIFKQLSGYSEDGTKSQDRVSQIVRQWTIDASEGGVEVYSTDLSKATDRIPIYLQFEVVMHLLGRRFAKSWYYTISQRDFALPNSNRRVRFNCGQPLGAYSSWAMLALIHNIICRHAMMRVGIQRVDKPCFVVVGDDNALIGENLEQSYLYLMGTLCRVTISPLKGFSPSTVSGSNPLSGVEVHSVAEFCKRVFYNGHELSTVSPSTILSSLEYPSDFIMLLSDLNKRSTSPDLRMTGTLAWLNYNSDIAIALATFPLTSAIPSNILVQATEVLRSLKIYWYDDEVLPHIEPVFQSKTLDRVGSSVHRFIDRVTVFRKSFDGPRKVRSWTFECPSFYSDLLHDLTSIMAYTTAKLVDSLRTKRFDFDKVKQLADGLINLDDLSESFFNTRKTQEDRPKRVSRYLSALIKDVNSVIKGTSPEELEVYRYYKGQIDSSSLEALSQKRDVAFIEVDDDWELVIPINFEANTDDGAASEDDM